MKVIHAHARVACAGALALFCRTPFRRPERVTIRTAHWSGARLCCRY